MGKIITIVFLIVFCISGFSQERFLQYTSKDTINGKPKVKGSFGVNLKLNGYYDLFGGLQNSETFNVGAINVFGTDDSGSLKIDMYQTQMNLESSFMTKNGKEINAVVEFDFWGGNGHMRLRKAYVAIDNWLIGQNWVAFGDKELWPNIMEYEGPPSGVWVRSPQISYYHTFKNKAWHYSLSLTAPITDYNKYGEAAEALIIEPLIIEANQTTPDFMAAVKYQKKWGHLRLSTVVRNVKYIDNNETDRFMGYGFSFSGIYWMHKDSFQFQITGGEGISAYNTSVQGFGYDGYPTTRNQIKATPSFGGWASYELFYSPKFHSNFVLGFTQYSLNNVKRVVVYDVIDSGLIIEKGNLDNYHYYGIVNLMYDPFENMIVGVELDYGEKKMSFDGSLDGTFETISIDASKARDAMRISFGILYNF